ncbi:ComEC/Rec2 family competence protein [Algibacter miyuki]|uniref:ComEC/Rec2 family competence protein n=1 Tax=Algibacter miyuki TaxID=1306933 RepID=A0ABV5GYF0_9FLAO|nr:ComEC/Rec2 family competence protein [Algibacter miyuki]MDN3666051.1 ComEC/Rec2 family competence protein [Algibacter miyuki]
MKLLNFTIIKLTICLITGILIGWFFTTPLNISLWLTGTSLLSLFITYSVARKQFISTVWFGLIAFISMISVGILTTNIHNEKNFSKHFTHYVLDEKETLETVTFRIREVLKPNRYYDKYVVDILQFEDKQTQGKSLLSIEKDSTKTPLKVDAVFSTRTTFEDLGYPLNPYQFDYKAYLEKKQIYHQLRVNISELFPVSSKIHTAFGVADGIRSFINSKLKKYNFHPDELAVINALFLGQRQDLSQDIYNDYKNAGAIHILAISGLHVGVILLILSWLLKPMESLKHGKILKTILLVILLWSFAVIAGLSASVTRAVTMFSIVAIAMNLKRPTNIYNTLAISIFIILLFKPLYIFDVGFQLSYMAVFAIVTIDPLLFKLWQPKNKILKLYWHTATVSIAAQLGIAPLLLFYFHQFAGLFLVSNLIIIPVLVFILGYGLFVIFMASISILPQFLADAFSWIISKLNAIIALISDQTSFIYNDIPFSIWHVLAFYLFIISIVQLMKAWDFKNIKWLFLSIASIQCVFIYTNFNKPSNEFIVFHKSRYSLIGNTANNKITVAHDMDSTAFLESSIVKNYTVGNFINHIEETKIQPVYSLNTKTLLVVDSLNTYNIKLFKPDYVLLRQSPQINLNRLIDSIQPKYIIADGSNYKSYVEQWKSVCIKRKLPFHNTNEKGAFIIEYE